MQYEIKQVGKFRYVEEGNGEVLLLLHGLFGQLSNFETVLRHFLPKYKVVVPLLPLFEMDIFHSTVSEFANYVYKFISKMGYSNVHLLGNSLGGHLALLHVLKHPENIQSLILTGSSGLFESGMGDSYPRRGDKDFVRRKIEFTFYDPSVATPSLVDEVYEIINNRIKAIKIITLAKTAIRNNLGKELNTIKKPTCLIWGNNDHITPPFVAKEFQSLITGSELHIIDRCGHAPMMEVPLEFNAILDRFLAKHTTAV